MTARPLICEPGKPTSGWWCGVASPTPWTDAGPGESKSPHSVEDLAALGLGLLFGEEILVTYRPEVVQALSRSSARARVCTVAGAMLLTCVTGHGH